MNPLFWFTLIYLHVSQHLIQHSVDPFIIIYASMKWRQRHRWLWIEGEEIFSNLPWLTSEWEKDRKHDRNAEVQDWHFVWNVKVCYGTERGMERAVVMFRISEGWKRTIKLKRGSKLICIHALTSCEFIRFHVLYRMWSCTSPLTFSSFTPTLVASQAFQAWTFTLPPPNMFKAHNQVNISLRLNHWYDLIRPKNIYL